MNIGKRITIIIFIGTIFRSLSFAESGETTVRYLEDAYYRGVYDCDNGSPAFLCSGILLRGTVPGNYHVWNPSPGSQTSGGVSFSYLREDSNFGRLAYGYKSGFIFTPYFFLEGDKVEPEVLCSFPSDAGTDKRDDHGCGKHPDAPNSMPCDEQNIYTGRGWYELWESNHYSYAGQCGFDVSDDNNHYSTENFMAFIDGISYIEYGERIQNELRIATWAQNIGSKLPIEAFFYLERYGNDGGKGEAQSYQEDFYRTTNIWVPIIELALPRNYGDDARFYYNEEDQAIKDPNKIETYKSLLEKYKGMLQTDIG